MQSNDSQHPTGRPFPGSASFVRPRPSGVDQIVDEAVALISRQVELPTEFTAGGLVGVVTRPTTHPVEGFDSLLADALRSVVDDPPVSLIDHVTGHVVHQCRRIA